MTLRRSVTCQVCRQHITLRIVIGHSDKQHHAFACPHCSASLEITLDLDQQNAGIAIGPMKNCALGTEEGKILNLNPDFLVPAELKHTDQVAPHLSQLLELAKRMPDTEARSNVDLRPFDVQWNEIGYPIWTSLRSNNSKIAYSRFGTPKVYANAKHIERLAIRRLMQVLGESLIVPHSILENEILHLVRHAIARNGDCLAEMYAEEWLPSFRTDFDSFIQLFVGSYSTVSPILIYLKTGLRIPENGVTSNFDFEKLKSLYSNCYELLGKRMALILQTENVARGNHPDHKLNEFKSLHKAARADIWSRPSEICFPLQRFGNYMRPIIRNSIAHNTNSIEQNHQLKFVDEYKGRSRVMSMSQMDFLSLVAKSSSYLVSLFCVEFYLAKNLNNRFFYF